MYLYQSELISAFVCWKIRGEGKYHLTHDAANQKILTEKNNKVWTRQQIFFFGGCTASNSDKKFWRKPME